MLAKNPDVVGSWGDGSGAGTWASDLAGATAELRFRGTGVDWFTFRGPDQGKAEIWVDGALVRTVDNYAAAPTSEVVRSVTGLADGVHTLRIVVLGKARPAADGSARLGRPVLGHALAPARFPGCGPRAPTRDRARATRNAGRSSAASTACLAG